MSQQPPLLTSHLPEPPAEPSANNNSVRLYRDVHTTPTLIELEMEGVVVVGGVEVEKEGVLWKRE